MPGHVHSRAHSRVHSRRRIRLRLRLRPVARRRRGSEFGGGQRGLLVRRGVSAERNREEVDEEEKDED